MRINWKMVDTHTAHNFDGETYDFKECPAQYKKVAENIIRTLSCTTFDYYSMSNFDKKLFVAYWQQIDAMPDELNADEYLKWFVEKATYPEDIRRARQWLVEHNFLLPKADVLERAIKAGENRRNSMHGRN